MKNNKLQYNVIKYKGYTMLLDIESYGTINNARPYDISGAIIDKDGNIIYIFCILSKDILTKKEFQDNCYYKDKLPIYFKDMIEKKGIIDFIIKDSKGMLETLNDIILTYNIKLIKGFNIDFDYKAINRLYNDIDSNRKIIKKWYKELGLTKNDIPNKIVNNFKKLNCFDIMYGYTTLLSKSLIHRLGYSRFCIDNSYLSDSEKNISSKEDIFYKYFINASHEEMHIGYYDVLDELELDNKLKQLAKTRELKNAILTLNTKVDKSVYIGNGLYTLKRVYKELELYPDI